MKKHYIAEQWSRGRWAVKHISGYYALPPTTELAAPTTKAEADHIASVCNRIAPHIDPVQAGDALKASGFVGRVKTWIDPRYQRVPVQQAFAGLL